MYEALEKYRGKVHADVQWKKELYQKKYEESYNKSLKQSSELPLVGNFVLLEVSKRVRRGFEPLWKGPYYVYEQLQCGNYRLKHTDNGAVLDKKFDCGKAVAASRLKVDKRFPICVRMPVRHITFVFVLSRFERIEPVPSESSWWCLAGCGTFFETQKLLHDHIQQSPKCNREYSIQAVIQSVADSAPFHGVADIDKDPGCRVYGGARQRNILPRELSP